MGEKGSGRSCLGVLFEAVELRRRPLRRGVELVDERLGRALKLARLEVEAHRLGVRVEVGVRIVRERRRRVDHGFGAVGEAHLGGALVGGEPRFGQVAVGKVHGQPRLRLVVHLAATAAEAVDGAGAARGVSGKRLELRLSGGGACGRRLVKLERRGGSAQEGEQGSRDLLGHVKQVTVKCETSHGSTSVAKTSDRLDEYPGTGRKKILNLFLLH